ncbi:MAG: hypothetical protein ABI777_01075 [Betaproteobacteria bacterium]
MSTENGTISRSEYNPGTISRGGFAFGVVLRIAFAGVWVTAIGFIGLFNGDFAPITAVVLALCGAGVTFASIRYLQRSESMAIEAGAPPPRTLPVVLNSTHQPA